MATLPETSYRNEYARYRFYFHRIISFYQKPAAKVSTALLLTITTIVFFAVFAIRPTLVTIAELLKKIEDQETLVEKLKTKAASLASASQEYALAQPNLALLDQVVPQDYAADRFVYLLEGLAADQGLAYSNFSVAEPLSFHSTQPPDIAGEKVMPLSIRIGGNSEQLLAFMGHLHKLVRLVGVNSVTLGTETKQSSGSEELMMTLSAQVYYLPPATLSPTPEVTR